MTELAGAWKRQGRAGRIPVRNLWLLMLYASDLYRHLGESRVAVEDNPDEIADLVAEILCHQVETRLMRNLSYGYESRSQVLSRVRGRIDVLATERNRLLDKGQVHCRFDALTIDTPRNRYVCAALLGLTGLVGRADLARRCRGLALSLERLGVTAEKPHHYSHRTERFGRHDRADQKMIAAAELVFSLALPTEKDGQFQLPAPGADVGWLRTLFEKAIAGFYAVTLERHEWQVAPGQRLAWQTSHESDGVAQILPGMKTDIVIEHWPPSQRLVIDTKFNSITTGGWYREDTLRSSYIYQMYAYLRSQERASCEASLTSSGMLLHPAIDVVMTERVTIQGHPIWFCTVDLDSSAVSIRERLLDLIRMVFSDQRPA